MPALKVKQRSEDKMLVAEERLWLTADRERVVGEGDPEAAFLLAAEGDTIEAEEAKRLGLGKTG